MPPDLSRLSSQLGTQNRAFLGVVKAAYDSRTPPTPPWQLGAMSPRTEQQCGDDIRRLEEEWGVHPLLLPTTNAAAAPGASPCAALMALQQYGDDDAEACEQPTPAAAAPAVRWAENWDAERQAFLSTAGDARGGDELEQQAAAQRGAEGASWPQHQRRGAGALPADRGVALWGEEQLGAPHEDECANCQQQQQPLPWRGSAPGRQQGGTGSARASLEPSAARTPEAAASPRPSFFATTRVAPTPFSSGAFSRSPQPPRTEPQRRPAARDGEAHAPSNRASFGREWAEGAFDSPHTTEQLPSLPPRFPAGARGRAGAEQQLQGAPVGSPTPPLPEERGRSVAPALPDTGGRAAGGGAHAAHGNPQISRPPRAPNAAAPSRDSHLAPRGRGLAGGGQQQPSAAGERRAPAAAAAEEEVVLIDFSDDEQAAPAGGQSTGIDNCTVRVASSS